MRIPCSVCSPSGVAGPSIAGLHAPITQPRKFDCTARAVAKARSAGGNQRAGMDVIDVYLFSPALLRVAVAW